MGSITELFTPANFTLLIVIFALEMILGFDNLLYISLESGRAPAHQRKQLRSQGLVLAVVSRVALLYLTILLIDFFETPFFTINHSDSEFPNINLPVDWISGAFNLQVLIFIIGGAFLIYTAIKEITHLLRVKDLAHEVGKGHSTALRVMLNIFVMNIVFSFDSVLTAMAISKVFIVMSGGVILSGIAMYLIADAFANFLAKNRRYEVLGLFVLIIVGISLISEGAHIGELSIFGYHIEPLSKTTFYFSVTMLFLVEIIQGRYQKIISRE